MTVLQVLLQYDGKTRLIESLHDNRTHGLVVGKEVEGGEEEEEAESQSVGAERGEDNILLLWELRGHFWTFCVKVHTSGCQWWWEWAPNWPAVQPDSLVSPRENKKRKVRLNLAAQHPVRFRWFRFPCLRWSGTVLMIHVRILSNYFDF